MKGASGKDTGRAVSAASAGRGDGIRASGARRAITEFHPAQGMCDDDRSSDRSVAGAVRTATVTGLATVRRRQSASTHDRSDMAADQIDLPRERRLSPRAGVAGMVAEDAKNTEGIQRQRPIGRRRWCGSGYAARREEILGRCGAADRHIAAGPCHPGRFRSGVVMDHRHAQTMGAGRQPPFTGLSTCGRDGQRSRGHTRSASPRDPLDRGEPARGQTCARAWADRR